MARLKRMNSLPTGGYATLGDKVYLGRVAPTVRKSAKRAGLTPVSLRQFIRTFEAMSALQRVFKSGEWYDTVRY